MLDHVGGNLVETGLLPGGLRAGSVERIDKLYLAHISNVRWDPLRPALCGHRAVRSKLIEERLAGWVVPQSKCRHTARLGVRAI